MRKLMLYPPFSDLCVIGFTGTNEQQVNCGSQKFLQNLQQLAAAEYPQLPLRVLNPSPAHIARMGGKYRYKLLLKCRNSRLLRQMLSRLLVAFAKDRTMNHVTAFADINPDTVL